MPPDLETSSAPAGSPEGAIAAGPPAGAAGDQGQVLVEALGAAWGAFTLYHDPTDLPVFRRAVETMASALSYPWKIEVGPDGFTSDDGPIPSRRDAVRRLARRMFAHGMAAVVIWDTPTTEDLRRVLEIVSTAPEALEAAGGPEAALEASGVVSIALPHRDLLVEAALAGRTGRPGTAPDPIADDRSNAIEWGPKRFIQRLLARAGGNAQTLARFFTEDYAQAYRDLNREDLWSREEVVHAFAEAIFHLPERYRVRLVSDLLASQEEEPTRMLLDQLTESELAELAPQLDDAAHPLLREYLRVAAEQEKGASRGDLLGIREPSEGGPASQDSIARRIERILRANPDDPERQLGPLARLRAAHPTQDQNRDATAAMVRDLLANAAEPDFGRLAIRWAERVVAALEQGRYDAAEARFDDAAGGAVRSAGHRRLLLRTLELRLTPEAAKRLTGLMIGEEAPHCRLLQKAAPLFAGEALIDLIGREPDRSRRRSFVAALVAVARHDPRLLLRHLDDARWFIVCTIVAVLGRCGHPEITAHLEPLAKDRDDRVRIEALLALHQLRGPDAAETILSALDDPAEDIRHRAAVLLSGIPGPRVDAALARRAGTPELDTADRVLAVRALGRRSTPEAAAALTELSGRRFRWARAERHVRRAARLARKEAP